MNYNDAYEKLKTYNQLHLLKWYDSLSTENKNRLLDKIESIDFSVLDKKELVNTIHTIEPIKTLTINEINSEYDSYKELGLKLLSNGKLACILLAGGMGSRLGSENPKGMYNIGINKRLSIFECQMNSLKSVVKECGIFIYLFIMTSPINDDQTRNFFKENNYFGYDKNYIKFFIQDEFPVTDVDGKVLLTNKYTPATAPNGNGGWFLSMMNGGLADFCKKKGIEYFNVYGVDNVLQKMADPVFLGAVAERNADCGSKVVKKVDVNEKVGVVCLADGHPSIIEYIQLTDELRYSKDKNGEYLYNFGVILNYIFRLDALFETTKKPFPIYKAYKKYPYMNDNGEFITPEEPNAYKREIFILDMIRLMNSCVPFEIDRDKEFAPVKNLHGVDSVDTARELLKLNGIEI